MSSGYDSTTDTLKANNFANAAGTGAPSFPNGVLSTGVLTSSSASITMSTTDGYRYLLLGLSGTQTVTLPTTSSSSGRLVSVKKISNSGRVAINSSAGTLVNDDIILANDTVDVFCDGSAWYVLKKNLIPVVLACYKNSLSTITSTATTITFDTFTTDTHSTLNATTGTFTAPRAGTYIIRGTVELTPTGTATNCDLYIAKNGTGILGSTGYTTSTTSNNVALATFFALQLAKNDTLNVQAKCQSGTLSASNDGTLKPTNMQVTEIPSML